jgi:murein DD-endopeptidase MepM/ murein hydrolase activator NlpD
MNAASVVPGSVVRNGFHDPAYLAATGSVHLGADLAAPVGTPVASPVAGVVTFAGWDDASGDGGNGVKLTADGDGASVGVWHLSRVDVRPGQRVAAGQQLGASGQTGNALYPHVHLQIESPPGTPIDPLAYLAGLDAAVAPPPDGGGAGTAGAGVLIPALVVAGVLLVLLRPRD